MDEFLNNLQSELSKQNEKVTLDRIIKFYEFVKANKWTGSICYYRNSYLAIANTHCNKTYDGMGQTIDEALNNILNDIYKT